MYSKVPNGALIGKTQDMQVIHGSVDSPPPVY